MTASRISSNIFPKPLRIPYKYLYIFLISQYNTLNINNRIKFRFRGEP